MDELIEVNKGLFDKLNSIPEIEALGSIGDEEEHEVSNKSDSTFLSDKVSKINSIFSF